MVFKAGESQGKSGSFFFFSKDRKFLIKTMTSSEFSAFKSLFPYYYKHIGRNIKSLLARIYGIFTVKMEDLAPVHFILMGNSVQTKGGTIAYTFDLKGSLINREVPLAKDGES
mmetsp:Transcript_33736/g.32773  ORF Transcript_33736/g.32773 Transcript_33736/m.32773 type:complete len:113 (+) Transcript_33736:517-855(+)